MTDLLLNSRQHGIDAAQLAIHPDEVFEFNEFLTGLYADMRPSGELQRLLFGQILHAFWNMRIARKHQTHLLLRIGPLAQDMQALGKFYTSHERAFHRAVAELRALQTELAYRATLAGEQDTTLPAVPPLVRTAEVNRQVRLTAAAPTRRHARAQFTSFTSTDVASTS